MALSLKDLGKIDRTYTPLGGRYIMALDSGTTSVRAIIVDEYDCVVAQASRHIKTMYPRSGWVEQDPMEILASQIAVMMEVQFKSGIRLGSHRGNRYYQPAGDHGGVGSRLWSTHPQRHRVAMPPYRRHHRRPHRRGYVGHHSEQDGTHARSVLLGYQDQAVSSTTSMAPAPLPMRES